MTKSMMMDVTMCATLRDLPHHREVQVFCAGRNGRNDMRNEDYLVVEATPWGTVLAVIDGITPVTGGKVGALPFTHDKVSTGWLGARIAARHIRGLKPGMTPGRLVKAIHREWLEARGKPDFPPGEIIGAVFTVFVPWVGKHGALWSFGDCLWGYRTEDGRWADSLNGGHQSSSPDALLRKAAIEAEMDRRGLKPVDVANNHDLRGEMARLGREALTAHRRALASGSWLNDWAGVKRFIHPSVRLPAGVRELVLATDGLMRVPGTIREGLTLLALLRHEDPLMLGRNHMGLALAKGFASDDGILLPFTDDVTVITAIF